MRSKQHFIFDFDGTLFDSSEGILNAIRYAIGEMGHDQPEYDTLKRFIGPPLIDSFGKHFGFDKDTSEEAIRHLRVYYKSEGIKEASLFPGIDLMLDNLLNDGKDLFIATSKPTLFTNQILDEHGMRDMFQFVQGSGLVGDIKEKTEIMHEIVKKQPQLKQGEAIMVGDTIHDIHGAHNVGMPSVAVLYGFGETNDLLNANPTHVADTVEELNSILT